MAINEELSGFLKEGLERGLSRKKLEEVLLETGWPPDQVRGGLSAFADVTFPVPVPRPKPYLSAREAFIYLILFTTLYISAFSLGSLLFELINRAFPTPPSIRCWPWRGVGRRSGGRSPCSSSRSLSSFSSQGRTTGLSKPIRPGGSRR